MFNHPRRFICMLVACSAAGAFSACASESRIKSFSMLCDGTNKTVVYAVTPPPLTGMNTKNFIQTGSVVITEPRGGLKFLRFQVAGHSEFTVNVLGKGEISNRGDFTGFLGVTPSPSGNISMQVTGACIGGGMLQGFATVWFFS